MRIAIVDDLAAERTLLKGCLLYTSSSAIKAICFCSETNSRAKNKLSSLFFALLSPWDPGFMTVI